MAVAGLYTLPETYVELSEREIDERISRAKTTLGSRLVILGHHYQRDEVVKFADYRGDSLKLSQLAASRAEADYIVFCAYTSWPRVRTSSVPIIRPSFSRPECRLLHGRHGRLEQVETCWEQITSATPAKVVPVTYINSTAAIKAFVGETAGRSVHLPMPNEFPSGLFSEGTKFCSFRTSTWAGTRLTAWVFRWKTWSSGTLTRNSAV